MKKLRFLNLVFTFLISWSLNGSPSAKWIFLRITLSKVLLLPVILISLAYFGEESKITKLILTFWLSSFSSILISKKLNPLSYNNSDISSSTELILLILKVLSFLNLFSIRISKLFLISSNWFELILFKSILILNLSKEYNLPSFI